MPIHHLLSEAVNMVSIIMIVFFALVGFIFWLGLLGDKKKQTDVPMVEAAPAGSDD